jgi:putative IMPACT (imprinted ancient) family translation regulator
MLKLKAAYSSSYEEKKSRFFVLAYPAKSQAEADKLIENARKEYAKARHICFVYRTPDGKEAAEENQEPIASFHKALRFMEEKDISASLVIVIRYFGGVLLGASRLERVYFNLAVAALKADNLIEEVQMVLLRGSVRSAFYESFVKAVQAAGGEITEKDFQGGEVEVQAMVPISQKEKIEGLFSYKDKAQ